MQGRKTICLNIHWPIQQLLISISYSLSQLDKKLFLTGWYLPLTLKPVDIHLIASDNIDNKDNV